MSGLRGLILVLAAAALVAAPLSARSGAPTGDRPGTAVPYRIEQVADTGDRLAQLTPSQRAILEKLNRADLAHLGRLDRLVVPAIWSDDELRYSPFPLSYREAIGLPKLLVIDQAAQAFAAYGHGRLLRWGPVSSGRQGHATPRGRFHLNWRSRGRHSTVNPRWHMNWYFNFDNARGLALHSYALPGYPASHACVRLLERDAIWIYEWGDGWKLDRHGVVVTAGTPLLIVGQYDFHAAPPWHSLDHLLHGIQLPAEELARRVGVN